MVSCALYIEGHFMRRCLCCDKNPTTGYHPLCQDCYRKYGDKKDWEPWLKFLVADKRREMDYDRRHPTVPINDTLLYG